MQRLYSWFVTLVAIALAFYFIHLESSGLYLAAHDPPEISAPAAQSKELRVRLGRLIVWNHYMGRVNAEDTVSIFSRMGAEAVITFLVPEGASVKRGQILVRFDSTDTERNMVKLKQDEITAETELRSLLDAELPIDLAGIRMKLAEQTHKVQMEDKFLSDSEALQKQGLLSAEELSQERSDAATQREKLLQLRQKVNLTEQYIDPAKVAQAKAKLVAAQEALRLGRRQLKDSVIRAPVSGVVIYKPINVGGGYRTVRVGDTVYKNQVFMTLPNTSRMVVECYVPESDFGELQAGMAATVSPVSHPQMQFDGTVLRVDLIAGTAPDEPSWQRFFHTVILLGVGNTGLYPGMSVSVSVLTYEKKHAVLVPRAAIRWADGRPYVVEHGVLGNRRVELQLGRADMSYYEALSGIKPGVAVLTQ